MMLGSASLMAQEEPTSFAFLYNGEVVPNGSVINIATVSTTDLGAIRIFDMHIDLKVKNVSEDASKLTLVCEGKENYQKISFCPNGNCISWPMDGNNRLSTTYNAVAADAIADQMDWLHASSGAVTDASFEYDGTVTLKAYPPLDDEDCAVITVRFNTAGTEGIQNLAAMQNEQQVEVFNLCGKKVADGLNGLSKGIYIIRQGNNSRKITIR